MLGLSECKFLKKNMGEMELSFPHCLYFSLCPLKAFYPGHYASSINSNMRDDLWFSSNTASSKESPLTIFPESHLSASRSPRPPHFRDTGHVHCDIQLCLDSAVFSLIGSDCVFFQTFLGVFVATSLFQRILDREENK
jgi:hypothetical protein